MDQVYLDHAATTPLRPEALEAMMPWLTHRFGNASGGHAVAREARRAVEEARDEVAAVLGCEPAEVVFTSGGTEADNLAVFGVTAAAGRGAPCCSAIEHHAVLHPVQACGGSVLPVGGDGRLDPAAVGAGVAADAPLVSVMLANNEVGTVQDLAAIREVMADTAPRAILHTDAVQAAPWLDLAVLARPAELVSVAAHKFGGPQGTGALVVRRGVAIRPQVLGGGQERERRSGTHDVAGIVGMAAALVAAACERVAAVARVSALRDTLVARVRAGVPDVTVTAEGAPRVPGIAHLRIRGVESESLLVLLDEEGICASAGSSCASGAMAPSHVLEAMGVGRHEARSAVRLSLGRTTTAAEVERAAEAIAACVARLRAPLAAAR